MPKSPEELVRGEVKEAAGLHGWYIYDLEQNRPTRQTPGVPDLYLLHPLHRMALWLETKAGYRTPTHDQRIFQRLHLESGLACYWLRSRDDFLWILRGIGLETRMEPSGPPKRWIRDQFPKDRLPQP